MTKNVAHVVVAKHKRRTVKASKCVVSKNVHFGTAGFAFTAAQSGTRKGLVKQRNAQAVLEGGAKDVRLKTEAEARNRRRKKPVAGVRHRA